MKCPLDIFNFIDKHIHNWVLFLLWPSCFILSRAISNCPLLFPSSILDTFQPRGRGSSSVSYLFAFLFCSLGSCGTNIGVDYHFLLQWTMFCQNSALWPMCLGWACTACLLALLSCPCPFAMTRLWSMKWSCLYYNHLERLLHTVNEITHGCVFWTAYRYQCSQGQCLCVHVYI